MTTSPIPSAAPSNAGSAPAWSAANFALAALLVFPWISPFASGPSSWAEPWLLSSVCAGLMFALQDIAALHRGVYLVVGALGSWVLVRSGIAPETLVVVAGCALVVAMGMIAAAGAQRAEFVAVVAIAWVAGAAISTGIGLVQYFGLAKDLAPWIHFTETGDAIANLRQRNQFASLTAIGMASVLWLYSRGMRMPAAAAVIAWLAVGNAATTSRTGLAELLVLGVIAAMPGGPRRGRIYLVSTAFAAYVVAALALPWLLELATGEAGHRLWDRIAASDPCSSRAVLWSNVLTLIAKKPWIGWGWGELDYAHFASLYEGPRFCDILDNAHNLPLHVAVELGLPAALVLCGVIAWAVVRAKPWQESDAVRQLAWAVVAIIAIHSLLEYPLWYGPFQIAAGLCLGFLWPGRALADIAGATRWALRGLAVCALAACTYALADYRRISQIYLPPDARAPAYRDNLLPELRKSWLFRTQVRFAELTITPLTRANAQWSYETGEDLLHYSPEPRIIEKVIESALMLGRDDEVIAQVRRYRAAFPSEYAVWARDHGASVPDPNPVRR